MLIDQPTPRASTAEFLLLHALTMETVLLRLLGPPVSQLAGRDTIINCIRRNKNSNHHAYILALTSTLLSRVVAEKHPGITLDVKFVLIWTCRSAPQAGDGAFPFPVVLGVPFG